MDSTDIELMLERYQPQFKDVVFLLDISESMSGLKIIQAVRTIRQISNNIFESSDRVSYVLFNEKSHVILPLSNKKSVEFQLMSLLEKIPL